MLARDPFVALVNYLPCFPIATLSLTHSVLATGQVYKGENSYYHAQNGGELPPVVGLFLICVFFSVLLTVPVLLPLGTWHVTCPSPGKLLSLAM